MEITMIMWEPIIDQLKTPFFLYPLVLSCLATVSIYFTVKFLQISNSRIKSIFYTIPLLIPIAVYTIFHPKIFVGTLILKQYPVDGMNTGFFTVQYGRIFSLVGILCLTGFTFAVVLLSVLYLFGDKIVCWLHGVIDISIDERPGLFQIIDKCARKAGVPVPRFGITENLEPNAFVVGYGKGTRLVFSLGLLDILDDVELEAVVAHEVAHIKNHDFHLMAVISALKVVSFFNPVVYILSSAIMRERETLADEVGRRFIDDPERLGLALLKIWDGAKGFSGGFVTQFFSGLFIVSEIRRVRTVFSAHPHIERRLSYIEDGEFEGSVSRDGAKAVLACFIIALMMFSFYYPLYMCDFFIKGVRMPMAMSIDETSLFMNYLATPVQGDIESVQLGSTNLNNPYVSSALIFAQGKLDQTPQPLNFYAKIIKTD